MPSPAPSWPVRLLKPLLLAPTVLLAVIGVVHLAFGWHEFLEAWSRVTLAEKGEANRKRALAQIERDRLEASLEEVQAANENLRRRWQALPKDPVAAAPTRTLTGPFPTRRAAWVRSQPDLAPSARVDTADILELGAPGHAFYRERLWPYRRAFGGEALDFIPVRVLRQGAFESIQVFGIRDTIAHALFTLTVNTAARRVIQRNVVLEGEGVSLHSVAPSDRFFVLDYGCCPGVRGFEIFNDLGEGRSRGSYHGRMEWRGDTLSLWKVAEDADRERPPDGCPGKMDRRVEVRKVYFRSGREAASDSVRILCLDPGG